MGPICFDLLSLEDGPICVDSLSLVDEVDMFGFIDP